jgi:hypothetical protein
VTLTIAIMALAVVLLAIYDIYAAIKGGFSNTISWVVYTNSLKYPIIPFAIGVLCGHFFWSQVC